MISRRRVQTSLLELNGSPSSYFLQSGALELCHLQLRQSMTAAAAAGGCDEKPVCTVKSSLNDKAVEMMMSQSSSSLTSHWCPAADAARARLCTPGIALIIAYHGTQRHRRQNGSHAANVFF